MGFVKIVQVDKFMILSIKNVYVIKLKIIIGIMFNVGDKADQFLQNIIDGYEKNPLSA